MSCNLLVSKGLNSLILYSRRFCFGENYSSIIQLLTQEIQFFFFLAMLIFMNVSLVSFFRIFHKSGARFC